MSTVHNLCLTQSTPKFIKQTKGLIVTVLEKSLRNYKSKCAPCLSGSVYGAQCVDLTLSLPLHGVTQTEVPTPRIDGTIRQEYNLDLTVEV